MNNRNICFYGEMRNIIPKLSSNTHLICLFLPDIDQLITISGMVIRLSPLIPEMREAFFKCYVCQNTASVEIERGRITEPTLCTNCNTNHSFALVHNRSQFSDKQSIKLQESPGNIIMSKLQESTGNIIMSKLQESPGNIIMSKLQESPSNIIMSKLQESPGNMSHIKRKPVFSGGVATR